MIKFFRLLFTKYKVRHYSFHTGTSGMEKHRIFIDDVNKYNIEIINSFVRYHSYSNSHKPESIHYVVKYKI
jgi:hypothetical protein